MGHSTARFVFMGLSPAMGRPNKPALPAPLAQGLAQPHLPSLDGLRALAVFMVLLYHLQVPGISGGTGVLIFFVLSGFLITWLLLNEEERFGKISLKLFYARRTLRIMPAFYVYWFVFVGSVLIFSKRLVITQAICSFLYINNYYQAIFGDPNTALSHTWSLGVEEQFYLLWPITFMLLGNNARRLRFLLWSIAAVWIYRELLVWVFRAPQGYIYEAFDTRADHLMIGCALAVALKERVGGRLWQRLTASPALIWITFALLLGSTLAEYSSIISYRDTVGFILEPLLTAVLIVQGIAHGSAALGAVLNWGLVRYLGTISYAIYLYHPLVVGSVRKLTNNIPVVSHIAGIIAVVAVASASYFFLEKPLQNLRARLSPDGRKTDVTAGAAGSEPAINAPNALSVVPEPVEGRK
jgi:peptidoglycan/LPS O-acetylase OafA/YrhL